MTHPGSAGAGHAWVERPAVLRIATRLIAHGVLAAMLLISLDACARTRMASRESALSSSEMPAEFIVRRYVEAFNRHDVTAMIAHASPDIRWHSLAGDSLVTETVGRVALERELASYFRSYPTVRSTVGVLTANGPYVAGRELVQWEQNGARKSQASLSVYEIRDGSVRRVWYYPAVSEAER